MVYQIVRKLVLVDIRFICLAIKNFTFNCLLLLFNSVTKIEYSKIPLNNNKEILVNIEN
jgi:hypothetical protein